MAAISKFAGFRAAGSGPVSKCRWLRASDRVALCRPTRGRLRLHPGTVTHGPRVTLAEAGARSEPPVEGLGEIDTFNDKQSQIAQRKTGDGRGPGDCSKEAA